MDFVFKAIAPNRIPPKIDAKISPAGIPICHKQEGIVWIHIATQSPTYLRSPNSMNPLKKNSQTV